MLPNIYIKEYRLWYNKKRDRSRKLDKTLWASVSPRKSERQPHQDTPVPTRSHRQTNYSCYAIVS